MKTYFLKTIAVLTLTLSSPHAVSAVYFSDPGFSTDPLDIDRQWALHATNFTDVWDMPAVSSSVVIAIVDTGIDETHEDLVGGHFVTGYNILTKGEIPVGTNTDDNGHGTAIAGIIGATPGNNKGIIGAAFGASLMPIKALGSGGTGEASDVAIGIKWAVDHGANIINLSFGSIGKGRNQALADAIDYAFNKDVLVVSAAGNDTETQGKNLDQNPIFPVCDDNGKNEVLGVTAVDNFNRKPDFANYGKACIDVSAPGKRIISTINRDPATAKEAPNSYVYSSGTSMAAPFVASTAAHIKSKFPSLSVSQIRDRIILSTNKIDLFNTSNCGSRSCEGMLGSGVIDVQKALTIVPNTNLEDNTLVRTSESDSIYLIANGKKYLVSPFVLAQRYSDKQIRSFSSEYLKILPDSGYAAPLDGTLVKDASSSEVFYVSKGIRLPVTPEVFVNRGFSKKDIVSLSYAEVNSWIKNGLLTPKEGSVVRGKKNGQLYLVSNGTLRAISKSFYQRTDIRVLPVLKFPDTQIHDFSKGDPLL